MRFVDHLVPEHLAFERVFCWDVFLVSVTNSSNIQRS